MLFSATDELQTWQTGWVGPIGGSKAWILARTQPIFKTNLVFATHTEGHQHDLTRINPHNPQTGLFRPINSTRITQV